MKLSLSITLCLFTLFIANCTSPIYNSGKITSDVTNDVTNRSVENVGNKVGRENEEMFDLQPSPPQQVVIALKCQVYPSQCRSTPKRTIPYYISFETNSDLPNEKGHKALKALSNELEREISLLKKHLLVIAGHTDSRGRSEYNKELSKKRALTVKKYLSTALGINDSYFIAEGYGEDKLKVKPDNTPQKRAINRRVEFSLFRSNL